jgi:hypothetical protein
MANAIHFNAIGSTFQDEVRGHFAFQAVNQKNEGDVLLYLAQQVQRLRFLQVRVGILGHYNVIDLRTEFFGALMGS